MNSRAVGREEVEDAPVGGAVADEAPEAAAFSSFDKSASAAGVDPSAMDFSAKRIALGIFPES